MIKHRKNYFDLVPERRDLEHDVVDNQDLTRHQDANELDLEENDAWPSDQPLKRRKLL